MLISLEFEVDYVKPGSVSLHILYSAGRKVMQTEVKGLEYITVNHAHFVYCLCPYWQLFSSNRVIVLFLSCGCLCVIE